MPTPSARRLLQVLSSTGLRDGLASIGERTSGGKEELIGRLIDNGVSVARVLRSLSLGELRDICRSAGAARSGSKDDLVERIIGHFAAGLDQAVPVTDPEPEEVDEPRALDEQRFSALFMSLKGHDLGDILEAFPNLRQSGSKRTRVEVLWTSHRSELTLLERLMNRDIEAALIRHELKVSGSKQERAARLVEHFRSLPEVALAKWLDEGQDEEVASPP
jgi:hypothetical protein